MGHQDYLLFLLSNHSVGFTIRNRRFRLGMVKDRCTAYCPQTLSAVSSGYSSRITAWPSLSNTTRQVIIRLIEADRDEKSDST